MPTELTPESIANLTETQKTNIRIIQNITSMNTAINDIQHDVSIHNKLLITGEGELTILERLRNVESFINGIRHWGQFIGGALIIQTLTFFFGVIIALIRFLPVLEKIAKTP